MVVGTDAGPILAGLAAVLAIAALAASTRRRRDERGAAGDGFMKGVVKVSFIVMLVAGGLVWIVDRAEENNGGQSDQDTQTERPDKPQRDRGGNQGGRN